MGVGLNADADYLSRAATGLAATGLITYTVWCWHRRSSGVGYALVSDAGVLSLEGNAGRFNGLRYDNTFSSGVEADPRLTIGDSGGETDFASTPARADGYVDDEPPFDVWCFFVKTVAGPAGSSTITVEWSTESSSTWHTQTRAAGTEGSITPSTLLFGRALTADAQCSQGYYSYAGARSEFLDETPRRDLKSRVAAAAGDWAYYRLANNSDTADTSGNGRTITFNGTITSEGDPTIVVPSIEQESFRFYNDDGSESAATALGAQDANVTVAAGTAARLRTLTNFTGDYTSRRRRLKYRKVGDDGWRDL